MSRECHKTRSSLCRLCKGFTVEAKMKGFLVFLFVVCSLAAFAQASLHASCKIDWIWAVNCTFVKTTIVNQINKWNSSKTCPDEHSEKCLYKLKEVTEDKILATHETPVKHYVDDLSFTFGKNGSEICNVQGYSTSEVWYAVLDDGTNYCNLHNLITGSGLDKLPKFKETTSDSVCTQYTSANCDKY